MKTNNGLIFDENDLSSPNIDNAGFHNSIYREKNITSYLTDGSLWTRISSGKFDDIFVGDYFDVELNGTTFLMRVACCNPFKRIGQITTNANHIMIIPDVCISVGYMNYSAGTTGGYVGSDMYKTKLPTLVGYLETALGATHVLSTSESLTSSVDENAKNVMRPNLSGASNATEFKTQKANLLSETEVYGYMSYSSSGYENGMGNYGQLPLFRLNPEKIIAFGADGLVSYYWLRNVASSDSFCVVYNNGSVFKYNASHSFGVRPRFIIG